MRTSAEYLKASDAARTLGVSAKALRLYEQRGLIAPGRTAAGWRAYGPDVMQRAAEIAAMRALGFSLAQIARMLDGNPRGLEEALAAHEESLEGQARHISATIAKVRILRNEITGGHACSAGELTRLLVPSRAPPVSFELPWPWGGERFALRDIRPLNYIVGPLFSGKTKLAMRIAEAAPNAAFLGLERLDESGAAARARLDADPALRARVDRSLEWLVENGAILTDALIVLVAGLAEHGPDVLVVDMVEQELDEASQRALIAHLRRRGTDARPLFLTTRSCEILDLASVGTHETIILCPANHTPPKLVETHPGGRGYEAVATCLASTKVRARTKGVIAWRPPAD